MSITSHPLGCPMTEAGKGIKPVPWSSFLAVSAVLPVWAVTVVPLSFTYQLGRKLLASSSSTASNEHDLDSGYVVDSSQIIPRSERKYDLVLLGATGFTGKLAARHLAEAYGDGSVKWAIAGRSAAKMDAVLQNLAQTLNKPELVQQIDTIVVDTSIPSSLPKLVEQTRVVATTAGPYALYGSSVVEFCAKFGTHYVDITGETEWVRAMVNQWQSTAQRTGATLVPFCGHDSVPWDLCVLKLQELLQEKCHDQLKVVSFWDEMKGGAPGGTLATAFHVIDGKSVTSPRCNFDPFLKLPDGSKSEHVVKEDLPALPWPSSSPFHGKETWTMPFVMASVNAKVVRWSYALRAAGSRSLVYREYAQLPDFKTAFVQYAGLGILASMMFNPLTASLLKRYVLPKPGEGPDVQAMEKKNFLSIKGEGIGEQGNRAECILYFNRDVGCLETSRMLVEAGLCLAKEEKKLLAGFMAPGVGLGNTLMKRLLTSKDVVFRSRIVPVIPSRL